MAITEKDIYGKEEVGSYQKWQLGSDDAAVRAAARVYWDKIGYDKQDLGSDRAEIRAAAEEWFNKNMTLVKFTQEDLTSDIPQVRAMSEKWFDVNKIDKTTGQAITTTAADTTAAADTYKPPTPPTPPTPPETYEQRYKRIGEEWRPKLAEIYKPITEQRVGAAMSDRERALQELKGAVMPAISKAATATTRGYEVGRGLTGGVLQQALQEKVYQPATEYLATGAKGIIRGSEQDIARIRTESEMLQREELNNIIAGQTQYDEETRRMLFSEKATATRMAFDYQMAERGRIFDQKRLDDAMNYDIWKTKYTVEAQNIMTQKQIDAQHISDNMALISSLFGIVGTVAGVTKGFGLFSPTAPATTTTTTDWNKYFERIKEPQPDPFGLYG